MKKTDPPHSSTSTYAFAKPGAIQLYIKRFLVFSYSGFTARSTVFIGGNTLARAGNGTDLMFKFYNLNFLSVSQLSLAKYRSARLRMRLHRSFTPLIIHYSYIPGTWRSRPAAFARISLILFRFSLRSSLTLSLCFFLSYLSSTIFCASASVYTFLGNFSSSTWFSFLLIILSPRIALV